MYPVSCVLGSKEIMLTIEPGTHGSTYGGNPLGCAVSIRALEVMEEEDLTARAEKLGNSLRKGLADIKSPIITTIRGKGLLNAIVIDKTKTDGHSAWDLCIRLKNKGLLVGRCVHVGIQENIADCGKPQAKPTHENIIRLAPPLIITEAEILEAVRIIGEAVMELSTLKGGKEGEVIPPSEKGVMIHQDE
jgi:ornithine--oxo-acid transaminase